MSESRDIAALLARAKTINILNSLSVRRDKRQKRDLHALTVDGMVMCNPRDKEAAHRAQTEGIATENWEAVTCSKCLSLLYKHHKLQKEWNKLG